MAKINIKLKKRYIAYSMKNIKNDRKIDRSF